MAVAVVVVVVGVGVVGVAGVCVWKDRTGDWTATGQSGNGAVDCGVSISTRGPSAVYTACGPES